MISSLIYDDKKKEIDQLNIVLRELAALVTDEKWNINSAETLIELSRILDDKPLIDIFLYDVMKSGDVDRLIKIREDYQLAHVMLLADATLSPMQYIRPGINAQSLLLRPYNYDQAMETLGEFVRGYIKTIEAANGNNDAAMVIDTEDGKIKVPYDKIYFIEAMDKKIFVCTGIEEYGFYGTLDGLMDVLPEVFLRCHRSFIVNSSKIIKVALSKNTIYLSDDYEVPLSRSYKAALKGL